MDEKRLQKVRENLNRHNERKKNQNIMSEVDSSKFDKTSSTYNKYDEGFERAKYHYQNSYLPKKAQKYYETVSEYKSPYQAVNKPSEDNTTVLTPDNLIANNLADGGYLDENTRNYVQKRTDEAFNNQYKKYAEQYSRVNSRGKEAYNAAQNAQKTANEINSNVDKFYSQFKDGSDYADYLKNKASAEENARLLSYDIPAARQKLLTMKALNMNPNVNVEDTDEYKAIVSDIEKAEAAQQFAKDMQNDNFRKEYEEFVQFQKDYENKNILEKGAEQVGNAVGDAVYNTSHGIYGVAKAANGILNSIFGVDTTQEGTLANNIDNFFEYEQGIKDRKDRYSSYYKIGLQNDATNLIGNEDIGNFIGGKIFESLNAQADAGLSMALAFATGGGSTVAKGLQAVSGLTKAQKISQAVTSVMKGLAKNPNFWYSFVREGGSAYNDAIASGATQEEALINLLATGTVNGYIEVSGGVEKVPNLKGRGIKAWLNEITKTSFEEGFEEVKQGVVSELVKRLTYAPETKLFSDAEDGSGIINPKRMYDEFYGGAVGGVFGGVIGKGINAASYVVANNMYKSDTMRSIIQSGQYADLVASMPESDFTKSDISKMFTSDMTEEQILKSLKKVSNKSLRKQYDSMISELSKISTDNVAGIIFTATGDLDLASQTAPIIRKLYDGQAITEDEAKTILKDERIAYLISETSGYDLTNASYEDVVTLAERGSFENLSGTSTGSSFGDLLLGNSQRAEEGRDYIASIQDKYANDLIGKPTFTANVGENESVTIEGIDHIEDGEVYVKLSNGVIQEAQSLDTDEVTTALLSYASEYDTETASAFIGGYSGNISVGEYARSFAMTRSAALTGLSAQQIASAAPMALSNIGQTAFDAAVKSVQEKAKSFASADEKATQKAQANQAKRLDKVSVKDKTSNTSTKEQKRLARFISKATGYTVTLVDSRNGYVNKVNGVKAIGEFNSRKGEIVLDIGSDNVIATALHEVTHYIKLNAPDEYKALCNFIIEYATRTGKIEEYLNAYTNGYKIDNVYELTEEMTADAAEALIQSDKFVEDIFNDADFVNAIAEEKQGIVRKFIDTLKSIVEAIKNYLKNGDVNHRIAAQLAQDVEALEQYEKLWVDALKAAVKNNAEMQSNAKENTDTESSGGKYSLNKNFSDKYDAWDKKRTGFAFYRGNNTKFSLPETDSNGNKLSEQQREYFKDSKVVDENGNLLVMYHGTDSYNEFSVFKKGKEGYLGGGIYLTSDKHYAERYANKNGYEGRIYETYVRIVNPLVVTSANPAVEILGEKTAKKRESKNSFSTKWITSADIRKLKEKGYDGIIWDFGGSIEVSVWESNQIKNIDNVEPTNNEDIRFSLAEPVEEKGNLIAVHNIYTDKLVKSLKLGGFPMPSIAVTKADMGHGNYGEISFVFDKSSIDPKANKANKVYGGDAWTPTYPDIEYKVNDKAEERLRNKYYDMYERYGDKVEALYSYAITLEDKLNREGSEQKLIQNLYDDTKMMQVFRLDTGLPYIEDIYDKTEEKMSDEQIALSKYIIEILGNDAINEFADKSGGDLIQKREELFKKYENKIYEAFKNYYISEGLSESEAESSIKNKKHFEFLSAIFKAIKYKRDGGITIKEKFDSEATEKAILDNTDQEAYKKWLSDNFSGIVEKHGIYNGKNIYTASGNRRSFDALHYEETLENVVKVMSKGLNGDTLFGGMGIWGVANKEYSSIDELKADTSRLEKISDDEYHEIKSGYAEQFAEIANAIAIGDSENDVIKADIAATNIVDAVRKSKTKSGIKSYLKKYYPEITDANVDDIVSLVHNIMNMPTGYFEAKPMRAIPFDEVRYVVLPDTLDEDIKKQLSDYGMQIREYEEGNEEDRTEKLNSLDDVKFSISEQTSAEYEMLTQENEELKAQVEALKNEMKLTKGHKVNPEAVKKLAKKYLKDYSSTADIDEVSAKLKEIFDYVASDNAYAEVAQKAMYELAYNIINNSETLNTEMRDEFKDILDVIKSTPIYVDSTTKAEIESLYGDYNSFRKSMFGRMRLTTNKNGKGLYSNETVDSLNQTLSEMLPGTFPADVSEGDALANIVDFIEMTKPTMQNEFEGNIKEAAYQLAAEMFDDYFDTPEIKTFADKQQAKLNKVINENRKARAELKQKIRAEQKEIYEKKLAEIKEKQKDKLKRSLKAQREAILKAKREAYKRSKEKQREKANIAKVKARIAKLVKSLSNDLLTNSQKHHVPEELKKITGELLANINLLSPKQEVSLISDKPSKVAVNLKNDLNELQAFVDNYGKLESDKDGKNNYMINFDPDLVHNINEFKEYLQIVIDSGSLIVRGMNLDELISLHNMLAALRKAINDVNRAYSDRLTQAISEIAEGSIAEINTKRDRPNLDDGIKKVVGLLDNYANFQMLDSRSFFYNMGDSSFKIHQALRDGLDIRTQKLQEAQAFFKDALSSFTKKEIKEIIEEAYDFDVTGGKLHMTKAQIMSLYELNKREQGKEHIYKGGIRPTNTKNKRNPKPIMVNQEDVLRIVSTLSDEDIKLADSIQKFLAKNCAAWGNEVTMDMYGYKKFVEEFYFPITSFDAQVNTNDNNASNGADKASMFTILNYGMTKALTPNANNAIDISNIFDVATKHIVEMSNYAGYAKPLSDAMRWFNYRNRSTGESVKGSMYAKYENKGKQYFVELIKDINNQKATGDYGGELTSMLVSGAKTASIAANLSVVVQQPTAYVRASAVLNPDILMKGALVAITHMKKSMAEVKQYCPIAYWKSQGYFDTSLGKSINETITGIKSKKDAVVEASMSLAGFMDDVTWAAIWESTKKWVQENHPDIAVDSQAFFDIASEKFRDVVDQTQVVDTVLHRPMILRSKNALVKMSMAFMSEPLKSANLVRNAALDIRNKKPGAKHKFVRALASSVLANLAAAATKAIIMALRDTGDDDWLTKWLNSFLDDAKNSLNPLNIFPVIKDIISMLNGFDVERMDMTAVAGIVDFAKKVFDYAQKDKLDDLFNLNTVYTLTRYLSQLTGVPVYNVLRDVDAFIDIFGDPIFRKPNTSTSTRVQKLYDAAMANDTEAFNNVYNTLKSEGKTQKEIESSLKSKIIDDSRGNAMFNELVDKAAKERINGNISESVRIVKELASTTALSADFWKACINARINKLNGRSEDREELISTGISRELVDTMSDDEVKEALKSYQTDSISNTSDSLTEDTGTVSMYTANDLVKSIQDGDYNEYSEMYQDMLEVKVTNLLMKAEQENKELTVDEAEEKARKSIISSMTDGLKKLIKSLYNSDKAKYKELKKWLMKNLDYSSKTIEGWLTEKE